MLHHRPEGGKSRPHHRRIGPHTGAPRAAPCARLSPPFQTAGRVNAAGRLNAISLLLRAHRCSYYRPIRLETDFESYIKSDTPASVDYDATSAASSDALDFVSLTTNDGDVLQAAAPNRRQLRRSGRKTAVDIFYRTEKGDNVFTQAR